MLVRIPGRRKLLLGLGTAALVGAALVGTAGSGSAAPAAALAADSTSSDSVPEAIRVPPGNRLIAQFAAKGVQVYQCTGGAWRFLEPIAALGEPSPAVIHFRGPSWESIRDGSLVEAATVASSPVPGAIPQLLLKATTTRGTGIFGDVTFVQRLDTAGGLAPTTTCKDGQTQGVPYTADYLFFAKG
jgi:hypothetical protein